MTVTRDGDRPAGRRRRLAGACCRDDAENGAGTGPDPVAGRDAHVVHGVVGEAGEQGAGAGDVHGGPSGEDLDDVAGDRVPVGRWRRPRQPDGAVPEVRLDGRRRRRAGGDDLRGAGRADADVVDRGNVEAGGLPVGEPVDGQRPLVGGSRQDPAGRVDGDLVTGDRRPAVVRRGLPAHERGPVAAGRRDGRTHGDRRVDREVGVDRAGRSAVGNPRRVGPGQVEADISALGELRDGQVGGPVGTVLVQVAGRQCPAGPPESC